MPRVCWDVAEMRRTTCHRLEINRLFPMFILYTRGKTTLENMQLMSEQKWDIVGSISSQNRFYF